MSSYNPYLDVNIYKGHVNIREEAIPQNRSFNFVPDEKCIFLSPASTIPFPAILKSIQSNIITELDKTILGLIATYEFLTTKQITDFLRLIGREITDAQIKSGVERLQRHLMIASFKFGLDESSTGNFYVHTLLKNGSDLAKSLWITHNFSPFNVGKLPCNIKKILSINQIQLAFLKSDLHVDWFKRGDTVSVPNVRNGIVRPSVTIKTNQEVIMFEVVRTGDFWEPRLTDKLGRYKMILDRWSGNSWDIAEDVSLVICGENLEHNRKISEITRRIGINVLYTEDILLCGSNFYKSIYDLDDPEFPSYYEYTPA